MKKFGITISIIIILGYIISIWTSSPDDNNNIENLIISKHNWENANTNLNSISRVFIKNKISGCGEYYIYEITNNEFAVACTSDGQNWVYYIVYPNLEKVYLANSSMRFESPY